MTVEVKDQEAEVENAEAGSEEETKEVKKTSAEVAKAMYKDDAKAEEGQEAEEESKDESKEVEAEKGEEDKGEQEETKDGEDSKEITLALSKDSLLGEDAVKSVTEFAKENDMTQKAAQAVLEQQEAALSTYAEKLLAAHKTSVDEWYKEIENDKDIGGENLEKNKLIAQRPLIKYGDDDLMDVLETSGYINEPRFFRYNLALGKAMGDDQVLKGEPPAGKPKSRKERMYPNDVKKE